jgi:DnaK suppressor protein
MDAREARTLLETERRRLLESRANLTLDEQRGHPDPSSDALPQDSSEVSEQLMNRTESASELESFDDDLAEVDAALLRLDSGTFGICIECGTEISEDRISAIPWVSRCIDDQRREEQPKLLFQPDTPR